MVSDILVRSLLSENKDIFINMVKRAGVIIKDTSLFTEESIMESAVEEAYPRIILRIAGLKDKDGNPIYQGVGVTLDYEEQEANIIRLITSPSYKKGIMRIAAAFTAASLMRYIPLNSDIKFLDWGDKLEEQANKDLDTILGSIIANPEIITSSLNEDLNVNVQYKIYFALNLDLNTLTENMFDRVTNEVAISNKVRTLNTIRVPEDKSVYIWYYMTSLEATNYKEGLMPLYNGMSLDQVVTNLSYLINNCAISLNTGIIASPNKEPLREITTSYTKGELYNTNINQDNSIQFALKPEMYSIELANRNPSDFVLRELLTIKCMSFPKELTLNKSDAEILKLRDLSSKFFDIKYGRSINYKTLPWYGPQSTVIKIGEKRDGSKKTGAGSNNIDSSDFFLDSFYFKGFLNNYNSDMSIRVSTDTDGVLDEWVVNFNDVDLDDLVANIFNSFYTRIETTGVLLSAVKPLCLQVVPIRPFYNYNKIVVDLLRLPSGLEVATGNPENQLTPFNPNYSSINLSLVMNKDCCDGTAGLNDNGLKNNGSRRVIKATGLRRSAHLQKALDKIENMQNCQWTILP